MVGGLLITLLRHADRVRSASLAQLVNVIAPIMTEPSGPAWRQTTFHPFAATSRHGRGISLRLELDSETYETAEFGAVPVVDAAATLDETDQSITIFAVNRASSRRPASPSSCRPATTTSPSTRCTTMTLSPRTPSRNPTGSGPR